VVVLRERGVLDLVFTIEVSYGELGVCLAQESTGANVLCQVEADYYGLVLDLVVGRFEAEAQRLFYKDIAGSFEYHSCTGAQRVRGAFHVHGPPGVLGGLLL